MTVFAFSLLKRFSQQKWTLLLMLHYYTTYRSRAEGLSRSIRPSEVNTLLDHTLGHESPGKEWGKENHAAGIWRHSSECCLWFWFYFWFLFYSTSLHSILIKSKCFCAIFILFPVHARASWCWGTSRSCNSLWENSIFMSTRASKTVLDKFGVFPII